MIGLFCIPVLIELVATPDAHLKVDQKLRGFRIAEAVDIGWKGKWNLLRSSSIGTVIGILPAPGGAIASLVAYAEARLASRTPYPFGRGAPNVVLATHAANHATVGAGLIPTLTLVIPGTPPYPTILRALLFHARPPLPPP